MTLQKSKRMNKRIKRDRIDREESSAETRENDFSVEGDYAFIPEGDLMKLSIPIRKCKLLEKNPRKNDEAAKHLAELIRKNGFRKPIVVNQDYEIKAGNTAWKAAKWYLNMKHIPAVVTRFSEKSKEWEYVISDNKASEWSAWDKDVLAKLMDSEKLSLSQENTGLTDKDLDGLFKSKENKKEIIMKKFNSIDSIKYGDIFLVGGKHKIMNADCTDMSAVSSLIQKERPEMCLTSPPYNAGSVISDKYIINSRYKTKDNMSKHEYRDMLIDFTRIFINLCDYTFVNLQMLSTNKVSILEYLYNMRNNLADIIIWKKLQAQPAMTNNVLTSQFEYIFIFSRAGNRAIGKKDFRGTLSNIFESNAQSNNKYLMYHRSTYPISFAEYFIKNFTNRKKLVIDPFAGTGTTMIACNNLQRTGYMIDKDQGYCGLMIDRASKELGLKVKRL